MTNEQLREWAESELRLHLDSYPQRNVAQSVLRVLDACEMNATAERLSLAMGAEDESPPFDLTEREGFQPGFVRMNRYSAEESK